MKKSITTALILLTSLLINSATQAEDKEKMHQHSPHVHGEAILNLVLEGKSVLIELQTPAANVLGFEHQPSTAEQRHAVEHAMKLLNDYSNVFQFDAGGCRQTSVDLRSPFADDDEDHRDHKHADKHDHAHHHDKDDSAHKEPEFDDEHGNHSEFHVVYQLTCTKPQAISTVDVTVFKYFPGFETVRLQWVGTNGQGMNKASQSETKVLLRP